MNKNDGQKLRNWQHESLRRSADVALKLMQDAVAANDAGLACACASELANMVGDSYLYRAPFREIHDKVRDTLRDLAPEGTIQKVWGVTVPVLEQCMGDSGIEVQAA